MATIYIVGTPIGNLEDLTFRAYNILRKVDFVLAEDTRKTKILLDRYEIDSSTPLGTSKLISYYQHSKLSKIEYIINLLKSGKDLALVTNAGTPGISDPGNYLLEKIWEAKREIEIANVEIHCNVSLRQKINIVPIPGVSSVTTILSVCGFPTDDFLFLGFLPKKKGRETLLKSLINEKRTIVFFESPFRVVKTLVEIEKYLGNIKIVVGRELTKKFEEILRGNLKEIRRKLETKNQKGEFVIILNNR